MGNNPSSIKGLITRNKEGKFELTAASYISVDEAFQKMTAAISVKPKSEVIQIREAYSRVSAEDVISKADLPRSDISHFDGYALRAEDTVHASADNPILIRVLGKIYPGKNSEQRVNSGEACYITTGSFLPGGTNAVIMAEETAAVKDDVIKVCRRLQVGENVIRAGKDFKRGETVLKNGRLLRAQDLGLLAALRIGKITVFKKPVVAIVSIGDELTENLEGDEPNKVVDSHSLIVSAWVMEAGGIPVDLGIAHDDLVEIREKIGEGLRKADLVLTIGGSSAGDKDFVSMAINSIDTPGVIIQGIKRRPGRVSGLAIINGKPVVILPGLIQSTIVGFHVFALPLIRLVSGLPPTSTLPTIRAKVTETVSFKSFTSFQQVTFVRVRKRQDQFSAEPITGEPNLLSIPVKAEGFIITPEHKRKVARGEEAEVQILNFSPFSIISG